MSKGHSFTIRTLGCKANQYDSQLLREDLLRRGFVECPGDAEDADVCIVNTCTVTAQSDAKSRQAIRTLKRQNPNARIVVTGCYAHTSPEDVRNTGCVDAVFDNPSKEFLAESICALLNVGKRFTGPPCRRITFFSGHARAFVKIQDGCDKTCSYCIVRLARGRNRSRPIPDIIGEIEALVSNGYREVVLTGIHIGSFGIDHGGHENALPELIENLRMIQGLTRVRLSSIDPNEINGRLIAAIRCTPQVCRHLHLPLQSGSDAILREMNRHYTRDSYLRTLALLRKESPGISITGDVMVGFPGETEEDFRRTREVVREAEFSKVHIFPFSSRPGTPAEHLPHRVPPEVIRDRIARLSADADAAALTSRQKYMGQTVEVLVEREVSPGKNARLPPVMRNAASVFEGFSSDYQRTLFLTDGERIENLRNQIVGVRVEYLDERYLYGRLHYPLCPPRSPR